MQTRSQTENRGAFECFPKLPIEIRRQIWHFTVQPQRILPSRPIAELEACREARQFLLEIYMPCFQPMYQAFVEYPISRYANFDADVFFIDSYIKENYITPEGLNMDGFWETDWTEFLVPEAMCKIKYLAIAAEEWEDIDPEEGMGRMESGEDARLQVAEFTALERLSLVMVADLDDPYYDVLDDPLVDLTVDDCMEDGYEKRVLVQAAAFHEGHNYLLYDTQVLFGDLEESRPGWKAPDVQLARIVR